MDLRMPGVDGITATGRILAERPATRVLVLTTYDTDADIVRAVEAGATGYLLKDTPLPQLADAGHSYQPAGHPDHAPGGELRTQDPDGNVHVYGHMRYYDVAAGDLVHAGDRIAEIGNEGQSTGPHLHYQIHRGGMSGRPIDPQEWLAEHGVVV